jgi:hypothetical protein
MRHHHVRFSGGAVPEGTQETIRSGKSMQGTELGMGKEKEKDHDEKESTIGIGSTLFAACRFWDIRVRTDFIRHGF